jgi:hypothetical protein
MAMKKSKYLWALFARAFPFTTRNLEISNLFLVIIITCNLLQGLVALDKSHKILVAKDNT